MKILHVGGYYSITKDLADQQRLLGHEVGMLGMVPNFLEVPCAATVLCRDIEQILDAKFDVVQFHLMESLLDTLSIRSQTDSQKGQFDLAPIEQALNKLKKAGSKLYYNSYGFEGGSLFSDSKKASQLLGPLLKNFSHIFVGSYESSWLFESGLSCSWLGPGFNQKRLPLFKVTEAKAQELRILHIPYRLQPAETNSLLDLVADLKKCRQRFDFKVVTPESISDMATLVKVFEDCDLFLEQVNRGSYGLLALAAMANGKTVLSGNCAKARQAWEQLSMSPVMDVNSENIRSKLEATLREPRCLRDLGLRSRQFIEKFHNLEISARLMLSLYEK